MVERVLKVRWFQTHRLAEVTTAPPTGACSPASPRCEGTFSGASGVRPTTWLFPAAGVINSQQSAFNPVRNAADEGETQQKRAEPLRTAEREAFTSKQLYFLPV